MVKKSTRTVKSTRTAESDSLVHSRALNAFVKTMENFQQTLSDFKTLDVKVISEYDLRIQDKKDELDTVKRDIDLKIQNKKDEFDMVRREGTQLLKNQQIECDQKLKEYRLDGCIAILKDYGRVAVDSQELENLRTEVERTHKTLDISVQSAVEKERKHQKMINSMEKTRITLENKAQMAQFKAHNAQLQEQVINLQQTIAGFKTEIAAQRDLTRQVAMANSKSAINQSFGK